MISWSSCCCWMNRDVVTTNETGPSTFAPNVVHESMTPWIRTYFPNYRTNFPPATGLFPLTTACLVWSWVILFRTIIANFFFISTGVFLLYWRLTLFEVGWHFRRFSCFFEHQENLDDKMFFMYIDRFYKNQTWAWVVELIKFGTNPTCLKWISRPCLSSQI